MSFASPRRLTRWAIVLVVVLVVVSLVRFCHRAYQLETLFDPDKIVYNFGNMHRLFYTNLIRKSAHTSVLEESRKSLPEKFRFNGNTISIRDWILKSGTTGLVVMNDNKLVFEQYYQGNTAQSRAISWSVAKSFVSALIGFAVTDGSIESLHDPVGKYVPQLSQSSYANVNIQDFLEMSTGIEFNEDYGDPNSDIRQLGREIFFGYSTNKRIASLPTSGPPGEAFDYISANTQVLGMVLEAATKQKLARYMEEKLWSQLGPEADALWLTDAHSTELSFGGLCMCTRDYARFGLLYLNQGRNLKGKQLLPPQWIQDSVTPRTDYLQPGNGLFEGNPTLGYAYHFWVPKGEEGEFLAIGVYGQFIYVNPMRKVVIAKNSAYIHYTVDGDRMEYEAIEAFRAIAREVSREKQ